MAQISIMRSEMAVPPGPDRSSRLRNAPLSGEQQAKGAQRSRKRRRRQLSNRRDTRRQKGKGGKGRRPGRGARKQTIEAVKTEPGQLHVMALNVNGIRIDRKRKALGSFIAGLEPQPDVCIITETPLYDTEAKLVKYPTYVYANPSSRSRDELQACGGVLILVKQGLGFDKADDLPNVKEPLNGCSILVYLQDPVIHTSRVTGVYLTPAARPTKRQVEMLTNEESRLMTDGKEVGHLIGGDLNHPSWLTENEDWVSSTGLWTLTDPEVGTFASGNSLDKFLYLPGDDIPAAFLREEMAEDNEREEGLWYPGITGAEEVVGNHHPVYIAFPCGQEIPPPFIRSMAVRDLEEEEWRARDDKMAECLDGQIATLESFLALNNATKAHGVLAKAIETVFCDLYTRKPKQAVRQMEDPFALFCRQNRRHPLLIELRIAHHSGRHAAEQRLLSRIRADSWKHFLGKTKPADTTKIYKMIQKQDGRRPRAFVFPCAAPLRRDDRVYISTREKCEVLADYYQNRFGTAPGLRRGTQLVTPRGWERRQDGGRLDLPVDGAGSGSLGVVNIVREIPLRDFEPFSRLEILKAVRSLATAKSPGPDKVPAEVYRELPSMIPAITALITTMVRERTVPRELSEVYVIPLDKPRKDPALCESKRPISLINTLMKITEIVIYNRIIHKVEGILHPSQYAYRRARGTETHLAELTDFLSAQLADGCFVYLASLDVQQAFDSVPHDCIMETVWTLGLDPYLVRFIEVWLRGRRFRVRLTAPTGRFVSTPRPILGGLPQGGVLSPLLWIAHINRLFDLVREEKRAKRGAAELVGGPEICLIYADDVAFAIADRASAEIPRRAQQMDRWIRKAMSRLGLALGIPKCNNLVMEPGKIIGTVLRRNNGLSNTVNKELPGRDRRLGELLTTIAEEQ